MDREYHAPTLVQLSHKGGKYYVCVTRPEPLRKGSAKQMMRSTSTTDLRLAKQRLPRIANEIYAEFDEQLSALHQKYRSQTDQPSFTSTIGDFSGAFTADPFLIRKHGLDKDPSTRISRLLPDWLAHLEATKQGNHKERNSRKAKLTEFTKIVGDLHVGDVKKLHGYQYAQWLNDEGKANKTVRSLITKVSAFLTWCEQMGKIDNNPLTNMRLSHYGTSSLPYLPFEPAEMQALFEQEMDPQDRLCLSLLAVTGARLDEIALLDWSQVQSDFGLVYLDLQPDETLVKTDGSHRVIPVHSKIAPYLRGGTGRLFDYPIDINGKSQNAASKRLMPYVRTVTESPRKVVHSLRGTFKQMLENAGITKEMIKQLEDGEISLDVVDQALKDNRIGKRVSDKITGHSARDTAGKYGFGPLLIPRANAVEKLDVGFLGLEKL